MHSIENVNRPKEETAVNAENLEDVELKKDGEGP